MSARVRGVIDGVRHSLRYLLARDASKSYQDSFWTREEILDRLDEKHELWLNNGYWVGPRTFREAQRELARLVGRTAGLGQGDCVLDAGFGYAQQDILWSREFGVSRIAGIDVTPLHVDIGRLRVEQAGLAAKIELRQGTATRLPFPDSEFDKVIALESAMHFDTRVDFFSEAHRVLRPGGILVLADMIPTPESAGLRLSQRIRLRQSFCPVANMYDRRDYRSKLEGARFGDVQVTSIASEVYDGTYKALRYVTEQQEEDGEKIMARVKFELAEEDRGRGIEYWRQQIGTGDYVLVRATKDSTPDHSGE